MLTVLLPGVVLATAAGLTLMAVFAARVGVFAPVAEPALADISSAVTLANSSELVQTQLNPRPADWHSTVVASLSEAEDLLDSLESHGIGSRELHVVGPAAFAVRWK